MVVQNRSSTYYEKYLNDTVQTVYFAQPTSDHIHFSSLVSHSLLKIVLKKRTEKCLVPQLLLCFHL